MKVMWKIAIAMSLLSLFVACSDEDHSNDQEQPKQNVIVENTEIKKIENRIVPGGLIFIKGQGFNVKDVIKIGSQTKTMTEDHAVSFFKIDSTGGWITLPASVQDGETTLTLVRGKETQDLGTITVRMISLYGIRHENGKDVLVKIDTTNMSETVINNNFKDIEMLSYIPWTHELIGNVYNDQNYESQHEIYSFEKNSFRSLVNGDEFSSQVIAVNNRLYGTKNGTLVSMKLDGSDEQKEKDYTEGFDSELMCYNPMLNCIAISGEQAAGTQYNTVLKLFWLDSKQIIDINLPHIIYSMCAVNDKIYLVLTGSTQSNKLIVLDPVTAQYQTVENDFVLDANMVYLSSRNELVGTPRDEESDQVEKRFLFKYNLETRKTRRIENTNYYIELFRD